MSRIGYGEGIAIAQLVFYIPFLILTLLVAFKHRKTSFAWFLLAAFCLIKIIGASARVDTVDHPRSNTAWTIALICGVFGLNPLLMATLGVLSRAFYDTQRQPWRRIYTGRATTALIHLPASAAVALCIYGATNAKTAVDIPKEATVKVGIVLFTLIYLLLLAMAMVAWLVKARSDGGQGVLIAAVLVALPFLAVRLLYGLLSIFDSKSSTFRLGNGNQTVALCMEVLEEMIVVLAFVLAGWKVDAARMRYGTASDSTRAHRMGGHDFPLVDEHEAVKLRAPVEQRR